MASNIKQHSQPHPRIEIRKKVQTLMKFCVDIDNRVFISRPNPVWLNEVPVLLIYFVDEPSDSQDKRPPTYKRGLELVSQVLQRQQNDVDDYLDSRAFEMEYAMEMLNFLGLEIVEDVQLTGTRPTTMKNDGNEFIESIMLTHTITYKWVPEINVDIKEFLMFQSKIEAKEGDGAEIDNVTTIRTE